VTDLMLQANWINPQQAHAHLTKTCTKCFKEMDLSKFSKHAKGKYGVRAACKKCLGVVGKEYAAKHKETKAETNAAWAKANKQRCARNKAIWYSKNKEKCAKVSALWAKENPEKIKAASDLYKKLNPEKVRFFFKRWYLNNPDLARKATLNWRAANPEARRIAEQNRRAKVKSSGRLSKGLVQKLNRLQKGKCPCCKKPLGKKYHLDHKIPLFLGGENIDENMQLLKSGCNLKKSKKHPVDFMQSKGFLL
jgi:5-methylcytosine-specific restriction endonuclease McrA